MFLPTGNLNNGASTTLSLSGIDQIDLRQADPVANQLSLSLSDLRQADHQTLVVRGESVDTVSVTASPAAQAMTTITATGTTVTVAGKTYATDAQGKINLASGGDDKFAVYRWSLGGSNQYLLVSDVITQPQWRNDVWLWTERDCPSRHSAVCNLGLQRSSHH